MGAGGWKEEDWAKYSSVHVNSKASVEAIYTSKSLDSTLNPFGIAFRESCDSSDNPLSTPVIVGLDVTGSMNKVLNSIVRDGLSKLCTEIYSRKPITNPHLMFMGIGDVESDRSPIQITQFEADIRIAEQLTKIFLEGGGGGNSYESYILAWYFAALHTKIDCFDKRGKKGILFTIGDELPTPKILSKHIEKFIGDKPQVDQFTGDELFTMVSRQWEVFHLIIAEGNYCSHNEEHVVKKWTELLGQRAIFVKDYQKIGEIIISILEVLNGERIDKVVESWDGAGTQLVVREAIKNLTFDNNNPDVLIFN